MFICTGANIRLVIGICSSILIVGNLQHNYIIFEVFLTSENVSICDSWNDDRKTFIDFTKRMIQCG